MPLVSVVIPTYNAAKFIRQAIDSALAQTLRDLEVVVVDDGSTDETAQIVHSYPDPRLHYVWQDHSERSVARNNGIAHSKGEYIALLDADDWWHPKKLEKQVSLLRINPQLGLVYCWLQQVGPAGEPLRLIKGVGETYPATGAWIFEQLLLHNVPGPGSSALIPRRCLQEVGGFRADIRYVEEWDLSLRLASRFQVGFVPEALGFYRAHGTYMPKKLHQLGFQQAAIGMLKSALEFAGPGIDSPLGQKALGRILYTSSLVDAGVGDYEAANGHLEQAMLLDPDSFSGNPPPFVERAAYFANALYDTVTPLPEALAFVRDLFANLSGAADRLKRFRRPAMGWTCAIHAFEGQALHAPDRVRRSFWRAALYDPRWLKNLGLFSIGLRACRAPLPALLPAKADGE